MKTFVLTVSKKFPVKHRRAGKETFFPQKIDQLQMVEGLRLFQPQKIHTIRANYDFWKKRIDEVNEGKAIISVRYWWDKPYNSKQIEICQLRHGEVGYQQITLQPEFFNTKWIVGQSDFTDQLLFFVAQNDGLSLEDFKDWFKGYDLSKPMIIIHFTDFRY